MSAAAEAGSTRLAAQLKGLEHASPLLRRQAALGVFALLSHGQLAGSGGSTTLLQDTVLTLLSDGHPDVVEEAVQQLVKLCAPPTPAAAAASRGAGARLAPGEAVHLVLLALNSAGSATAPLLAGGIVPLLQQQQQQQQQEAAGSAAPQERATTAGPVHPLASALLSSAAAAPGTITAAVNWLAAAAGTANNSSQLQAAWRALRPFFAFVLLPAGSNAAAGGDAGAAAAAAGESEHTSSSAGTAVPWGMCSMLLSQLLGLASCDAGAAALVLPLVLQQMRHWRADSAADRLATTQALSDVLDVLAGGSEGADSSDAAEAAWWYDACHAAGDLLLLLASRAVSPPAAIAGGSTASGGSGSSSSGSGVLLQLMWRLGGDLCPGLWRGQLLGLAWLLLCVSSTQDQVLLLKLVAAQLTAASITPQQEQAVAAWQCGALRLPLLQAVVFSTHKGTKVWAAAVLGHLRSQPQPQQLLPSQAASSTSSRQAAQQGPLAALSVVHDLLRSWWPYDGSSSSSASSLDEAVHWLHSYTASLQQPGAATASSSSSSAQVSGLSQGGGAAWCAAQGINPALQLLLAALLQHPSRRVALATCGVLQQLLTRLPQLAPAFLPLVLQQLRASYTQAAAQAPGACAEVPAAAVSEALLGLLPAMCRDASCSALVWRVLRPLSAAAQQAQAATQQARHIKVTAADTTTAGLLRAVAVKLSVSAWALTGRGWGRAEAAVNGSITSPGGLVTATAAAVAAAGAGAAEREPLELRLLRAQAVRDVLASSPARGLELLGCLQDSLADPQPGVCGAALLSLDLLLSEDELDFYTAWPVVTRLLSPSRMLAAAGCALTAPPPQQQQLGEGQEEQEQVMRRFLLSPADAERAALRHSAGGWAAAAWVGLLARGALDAPSQPELAAGLVTLAWMATGAAEAQVRAAAYSSLAAWPLATLALLELPAAAADYLAPLEVEAAALAAALERAASGGKQQQAAAGALAAHRAAVAAAEQLAALAVAHEHANRRRFLAAAGRAGGGAGSSAATAGQGGSSSSSSAAEREAAALRHRLLHTLPKSLTAAGGEAGTPAHDGGGLSPGVLLLLWQPGGNTKGDAAAAAYERVFADVSRWGSFGGGSLLQSPGFAAAAWQAFTARWLAAAGGSPSLLLSKLAPGWQDGLPSTAAASLAAAAGLAAGGSLSEAQLSELMGQVTRLTDPGNSRSSAVSAAALTALSRLLGALHLADWANKEALTATLHEAIADVTGPSSSGGGGVLAAAAAEAAGYAGTLLLRQHGDNALFAAGGSSSATAASDRGVALGCSCLGLLLSCYSALWRDSCSSQVVTRVVAALPLSCQELIVLQELQCDADTAGRPELATAVLRGCCCLLAALHSRMTDSSGAGDAAAAAAAAGAFAGSVLSQLSVGGGTAAQAAAVAAAAPAAAAAALQVGCLHTQELPGISAQLEALAVGGAAAGADGRLAAAAALSWSQLAVMQLAAAVAAGGGADAAEAQASRLIAWCTEQPGAAAKPPAVLRCAAAAALSVLLGCDVAAGSSGDTAAWQVAAAAAGSGSSSMAATQQQAMGVPLPTQLKQLPHVRACLKGLEAAAGSSSGGGGSSAAATAWLLAAVCHEAAAAKQRGGAGSSRGAAAARAGAAATSAATSAATAAAPALALYPATGALRPVAERVLSFSPAAGCSSSPESLTAALTAAACVRCLASAPRLPSADWSGVCRRLVSAAALPAGSQQGVNAAAAVAAQLQVAGIELLLGHCQAPSLELAGVLDACLSPDDLRRLPALPCALLLQQLDVALAALPANRGSPLLAGLVQLTNSALQQQRQPGQEQQQLMVVLSAWCGLLRLCQAAAAAAPPFTPGHSQLAGVLHSSIGQLLELLPPLHGCLCPADVLQLAGRLQQQQHEGDDAEEGAGDAILQRLVQQHTGQLCWGGATEEQDAGAAPSNNKSSMAVWRAAVACLCQLHPDVALQLTAPPQPAQAASADAAVRCGLLRSLLVLAGRLDWRQLADCRNAVLRRLPAGDDSAADSAADSVLLALALGGATAPQPGFLQQLQELADVASLAAAPRNVAVLAAALTAAWLAASSCCTSGGSDAEAAAAAAVLSEQQLALGCGGSRALAQLSAVLPQLLHVDRLAGSRAAFAEAVLRPLRAIEAATRVL